MPSRISTGSVVGAPACDRRSFAARTAATTGENTDEIVGRWRKLDVPDKATRVAEFHGNTLHALRDLLCAAGLEHPDQLGPEHILRRVSPTEVRSLAALYSFLRPGELLGGRIPEHAVFQDFWQASRSDAFMPPEHVMRLRSGKSN